MDQWSREELAAAVRTYLFMLGKERSGESYSKKDVYRQLSATFERTEKAFEYRMQNISYVLSLMGHEWIKGLKPARNVGLATALSITEAVQAHIPSHTSSGLEFDYRVGEALRRLHQQDDQLRVNLPFQFTGLLTPETAASVLYSADGMCFLCKHEAPFLDTHLHPHLEVFSFSASDVSGTEYSHAIAVCPNCHSALKHSKGQPKLLAVLREQIYRPENLF